MSTEMNNTRLAILREYRGTIESGGESGNQIVARISFLTTQLEEQLYNELFNA